MTVRETIKLPRGYRLRNPFKPHKISGSGADFEGAIKQKGGTILIQKSLFLKKRIYQPVDWKSFREGVIAFKKPDARLLVLTAGGKQ